MATKTTEVKITDEKLARWLLSDPIHPTYSEQQKFMLVRYGVNLGLWMLVKGCFER